MASASECFGGEISCRGALISHLAACRRLTSVIFGSRCQVCAALEGDDTILEAETAALSCMSQENRLPGSPKELKSLQIKKLRRDVVTETASGLQYEVVASGAAGGMHPEAESKCVVALTMDLALAF